MSLRNRKFVMLLIMLCFSSPKSFTSGIGKEHKHYGGCPETCQQDRRETKGSPGPFYTYFQIECLIIRTESWASFSRVKSPPFNWKSKRPKSKSRNERLHEPLNGMPSLRRGAAFSRKGKNSTPRDPILKYVTVCSCVKVDYVS